MAVNWVLETKVVVRFAPPKETVAPLTKLEPVMVRVKFPTFRDAGEILETWGIGFQSVTALVLFTEFLEDSSASIVTKFGEGRVAGAVKFPLASIRPLAALPPATPLTSQVSGLVVMEGVNCWVEPARTFAVLGEIVSVSPTGGTGAVPPGESAQLEVINIKATTAIAKIDERRTEPPRRSGQDSVVQSNPLNRKVLLPAIVIKIQSNETAGEGKSLTRQAAVGKLV